MVRFFFIVVIMVEKLLSVSIIFDVDLVIVVFDFIVISILVFFRVGVLFILLFVCLYK